MAGIGSGDMARLRVGLVLGTTTAVNLGSDALMAAFFQDRCPDLAGADHFLEESLAASAGRLVRISGPVLTINNACTSGADAIGIGKLWLDEDLCDVVLAGGADETPMHLVKGFDSLQLNAPGLARPFDKDRCGMNLGEGAGILVLESAKSARLRGTPALGRLLGYGAACDHFHPTSPDPQGAGLALAIDRAMTASAVRCEQIAFINAHGTATCANDLTEAGIFNKMFPAIPVVSTKGHTGHTMAAAGALEAIFTLISLRLQKIPATRGFFAMDPAIGFCPTKVVTPISGCYALSTSLGFGGANAALVLEAVHE